jgi:hypothetical protein
MVESSYRNLSLGFVTKTRACKGAGQKWSSGVTFHVPKSVGECEGLSPHTPKWTPTLGVGVLMDFKNFRGRLQGSKLIRLKKNYTIENFLKRRCLKWVCMTHLGTLNISYGQNKSQESNCQFDSRPLKVRNSPDLLASRCRVTYHWKYLNKDYNVVLNLTSIGSLHKKLWASKVTKGPILRILGLPTWESHGKITFGCRPHG